MNAMPNACPVDGCPRSHGPNQLMCRRHWNQVPKELRDRVWNGARLMWDGGGSERWKEAAAEAVAAVELRELQEDGSG